MFWLILALVAAFLETFAVQRQIRKLELIAKPAVMIFLFFYLLSETGLQGNALWFGLGILFSLAGDIVLLNSSDRMFMLGLVAFLITHIFYIVGFRDRLFNVTAWSVILLFMIFLNGIWLLRHIVNNMRAKGQNALVYPVLLYGLVISLMLYAAMSTLFDSARNIGAVLLVCAGAFLFYLSDLILGWQKFVSPIRNGPVFNIITYQLGQIGSVAGIIIMM